MMKKLILMGLALAVSFYAGRSDALAGVAAAATKGVVFVNESGRRLVIKQGDKKQVVQVSASINKTAPGEFANNSEVYISIVADDQKTEDYSLAWPIKIPAGEVKSTIYLKFFKPPASSSSIASTAIVRIPVRKTGEPENRMIAVRDSMSGATENKSMHPAGRGLFGRFNW
jgi:hypothetical protein